MITLYTGNIRSNLIFTLFDPLPPSHCLEANFLFSKCFNKNTIMIWVNLIKMKQNSLSV